MNCRSVVQCAHTFSFLQISDKNLIALFHNGSSCHVGVLHKNPSGKLGSGLFWMFTSVPHILVQMGSSVFYDISTAEDISPAVQFSGRYVRSVAIIKISKLENLCSAVHSKLAPNNTLWQCFGVCPLEIVFFPKLARHRRHTRGIVMVQWRPLALRGEVWNRRNHQPVLSLQSQEVFCYVICAFCSFIFC